MILSSLILIIPTMILYNHSAHTKKAYLTTFFILFTIYLLINFPYLGVNYMYRDSDVYIEKALIKSYIPKGGGRFAKSHITLELPDNLVCDIISDEDIYYNCSKGDSVYLELQNGYFNMPVIVNYNAEKKEKPDIFQEFLNNRYLR